MKEKSEQELIQECLNGDSSAFNVLVNRYQYAVYGMCYYYAQNFSDAQDLTQESFLQAFLNLHQLREIERFPAWLRQVTINVCRMWKRRQDGYSKVSLEDVTEEHLIDQNSPSPREIAEKNELQSMVQEAISSLSEKNRLTVTLYYIDGLTYEEISNFLEIPQTTIKSRLYKARKQLRKGLLKMVRDEFQQSPLPEDFSNQVLQEVEVTGIDVDVIGEVKTKEQIHPILILNSKDEPDRHLPIWIGSPEATAISLAQQDKSTPRPLTHDLIVSLLQAVNATIQKVIVTDLQENTFIGKIILECNGQIKEIDCRPSDAVAIAVRVNAPIFVSKKIEEKGALIQVEPENLKETIQKLRQKTTVVD